MNQVIGLSSAERVELFSEAGLELGLPPFYVEKDFWVCWVLWLLFDHDRVGKHLTFRGGTSLSKGWGLIKRFSEDIDLAMSREWVDPELPNPSETGITAAQRDRRLRRLRGACRRAIRDELVPLLEAGAGRLGDGAQVDVVALNEARDPFVIELRYPVGGLQVPADYHRAVVKLELSGRADDWPQEDRPITPFVADAFPKLGTWTPMQIACVTPARTFWEKAALLHERYARGDEVRLAARQVRHLYDLVQLWEHVKGNPGLRELFSSVKLHRKTFWNFGHVDYDVLQPNDLKLVPPQDRMSDWRGDYQAMRPMFIGDPPKFDELIQSLRQIEAGLGTIQ